MLAVIAKLKVVAGKESEFEKVMLGLAKEVRANEPGNKMYTLTKSDAGEYLMLELYDNEAASGGSRSNRSLQSGRSEVRRTDGRSTGNSTAEGHRLTKKERGLSPPFLQSSVDDAYLNAPNL